MKTDPHPPMPPPNHEAIEAAAAVWLSLRDRGLDESETAEFMRWMQQDPQHAEVFNALDRTWRQFDRVSVLRAAGPAARPAKSPRRLATALAAAAALALAAVGWQYHLTTQPTAETPVGGLQKLDLPDGSVALLNTDSAVRVRYTAGERRILLDRGEAHFTVARNPDRPFVVAVDAVAVRAVGTAFNVRRRAESVEVVVTEGRVAVASLLEQGTRSREQDAGNPSSVLSSPSSAVHVAVGEQVTVSLTPAPAAQPPQVDRVASDEMERRLAWQERRLEFDGTPLGEAVAEFNRYNRHQLVIADPRLATRRFGGTFRSDGHELFVRLLEENFGVVAERQEAQTMLRLAP